MLLEVLLNESEQLFAGLEGQIKTFAIIGAVIGVLVTMLVMTALISIIVIAKKLCQIKKDGLKVSTKKGYFEGD